MAEMILINVFCTVFAVSKVRSRQVRQRGIDV